MSANSEIVSMSNEAEPPTTEAKETRWSESSRARPSESQANVSSNVRYGHGPIKAPATASPRRQVEGKKSPLRQQKIIPIWGRIAVASCMTAPVCQTEGDIRTPRQHTDLGQWPEAEFTRNSGPWAWRVVGYR